MSDVKLSTPGWPALVTGEGSVPASYFGVWSRTLLETPDTYDTSTFVRWMQLGAWHVDLRVAQSPDGTLQGFCGITEVAQVGAQEMCTWHRLVDYQPPRATVDEGWMVFETPERVLETGIHGVYYEIWDRLPGSTARRIALAEPKRADGKPSARLFIAGDYVMRVRPAEPLGPDFEISFGKYSNDQVVIEASTIASMTSSIEALSISQASAARATVIMNNERSEWTILEWTAP